MMPKQAERQWQIPRGDYEWSDYQCPTTGVWFHPLSHRLMEIGDQAFVWVYCPICDHHCRVRGQDGYDPMNPQPHCYTLVNGKEL
jgi:hypothetical protein